MKLKILKYILKGDTIMEDTKLEERFMSYMAYETAINGKVAVQEFKDYLTDTEKGEIVRSLITFDNCHLIVDQLDDLQVIYGLYKELERVIDVEMDLSK